MFHIPEIKKKKHISMYLEGLARRLIYKMKKEPEFYPVLLLFRFIIFKPLIDFIQHPVHGWAVR